MHYGHYSENSFEAIASHTFIWNITDTEYANNIGSAQSNLWVKTECVKLKYHLIIVIVK